MKTLLNSIIKADILTVDQANKVNSLISLGYEFHSLFKDGSVELKSGDELVYVERSGEMTTK